ncbi:MAG TPA: mycothiol synthase [Segeticoccus sp.]|uniref:mycothiol synthase n=1 Tax=Segeticoccus sp. TaxID=2706531 RepID=UPI002D810D83|nr:mycothiol synthase [Segeticoccus sp.]HET8600624.1 mycothiol synthase [Segeticoccus sp.]
MQVDGADRLNPGQVEQVLELAGAAALADQVRPLSEQTLLVVRGDGHPGVRHYLVGDDARLVGYAQRTPGEGPDDPSSAEVVVAPGARRRGVGRALLDAVLAEDPRARVWAHGDLEAGRALASSAGLESVRQLWQMRRPLHGEWTELPAVELPEGFVARSFEPGRAASGDVAGAAKRAIGDSDEDAWLRVNARAFASHAEQGRMTRADLDQRMAEPWFDPKGFILVEDVATVPDRPTLAAFHWTKVEPPEDPQGHPTAGEVYVVGVDPAYQGRGLGKVVTVLGLQHLRDLGLDEATLYVDGDNEAALATYARLGFERSAVDVMYAAPHGSA